MKPEELKTIVREKYGEIARKSYLHNSGSGCCGLSKSQDLASSALPCMPKRDLQLLLIPNQTS
jgi:hypothetical protein